MSFKRQQHGRGHLFSIAGNEHGPSLSQASQHRLRIGNLRMRRNQNGHIDEWQSVFLSGAKIDGEQTIPDAQPCWPLGNIQNTVVHRGSP
jgi:hypothetical protein